jgi:hypothetical protein
MVGRPRTFIGYDKIDEAGYFYQAAIFILWRIICKDIFTLVEEIVQRLIQAGCQAFQNLPV